MAVLSTNRATGEAVAAYRAVLQAERKLAQAEHALTVAISDPDVEMSAYLHLTSELDSAAEEGRPLGNVGLADVKR